jgi:hypothetical protein
VSGSVLSLYLPSPHAALYDRGKFIGCTGSVPSPMTLALRRKPNGSALPKFPSSVSDGGWFRGFTGSLLRCGLSSCSPPCTDLTRHFSQPTGTFTPELPASRSPFSSSGITTVAPERLHRWDFHPLERQLASLHRLLHPLLHAGLARRTNIPITLIDPVPGEQTAQACAIAVYNNCVRVARENEAARAADAASCIDTSLGTVLLKNGWGRR